VGYLGDLVMAAVKKSIAVTKLISEALRENQAKPVDMKHIREKLVRAERTGFIDKGRDEILQGFKNKLGASGEL